jgi:Flp pilus assembly protein TadG
MKRRLGNSIEGPAGAAPGPRLLLFVAWFWRIVKPLRREHGQAAIEFLLVLPIFVPVVLLTVDFGMMLYEYVSISNAANEGARYAAVNCDTGTCTVAEIQDWTVTRSGGILSDSDTGEVTVGYRNVNGSSTDGATGKGDSVVVRVSHTYNFLFFPFSQTVSSCSDYRLEQADSGTGLPSGNAC